MLYPKGPGQDLSDIDFFLIKGGELTGRGSDGVEGGKRGGHHRIRDSLHNFSSAYETHSSFKKNTIAQKDSATVNPLFSQTTKKDQLNFYFTSQSPISFFKHLPHAHFLPILTICPSAYERGEGRK